MENVFICEDLTGTGPNHDSFTVSIQIKPFSNVGYVGSLT